MKKIGYIIIDVILAILGLILAGVSTLLPFVNNQSIMGYIGMTILYIMGGCCITYGLLCFRKSENTLPQLLNIKKTSSTWALVAIILPTIAILSFTLLEGKWTIKAWDTNLLKIILMGGIAAPIVEELIFRGFLYRSFLKWTSNQSLSLVVPSAIFGLLHLANGSLSAQGTLMLLIAGIAVGTMFSLIYTMSGSLVNSILVHSGWNIITGLVTINAKDNYYLANYNVSANPPIVGEGGIDTALISIVLYTVVCFILLSIQKRGLRKKMV